MGPALLLIPNPLHLLQHHCHCRPPSHLRWDPPRHPLGVVVEPLLPTASSGEVVGALEVEVAVPACFLCPAAPRLPLRL